MKSELTLGYKRQKVACKLPFFQDEGKFFLQKHFQEYNDSSSSGKLKLDQFLDNHVFIVTDNGENSQ